MRKERFICGEMVVELPMGPAGPLWLFSGAVAYTKRDPDVLLPAHIVEFITQRQEPDPDAPTHEGQGLRAWAEGAAVKVELPDGQVHVFSVEGDDASG